MGELKVIGFIVLVVVTSISVWLTAIRMRRKISRSLGKDASGAELTSIATWMKVDEAEEKKRGGKHS